MSETDLIKRLRETVARGTWFYADAREAADAIERLTAERRVVTCLFCDEKKARGDGPNALPDLWAWVKEHAVTCALYPAVMRMQAAEADRYAKVREAFMAARRARKWRGVWSFDVRTGPAANIVEADDAEAFTAYLASVGRIAQPPAEAACENCGGLYPTHTIRACRGEHAAPSAQTDESEGAK
jgi:hypothetical protein